MWSKVGSWRERPFPHKLQPSKYELVWNLLVIEEILELQPGVIWRRNPCEEWDPFQRDPLTEEFQLQTCHWVVLKVAMATDQQIKWKTRHEFEIIWDSNDQNQMFSICFPPGSSRTQAVSLAGKMASVGKAGIAMALLGGRANSSLGGPQASQNLVLWPRQHLTFAPGTAAGKEDAQISLPRWLHPLDTQKDELELGGLSCGGVFPAKLTVKWTFLGNNIKKITSNI